VDDRHDGASFAERLNYLFATHLSPRNKRYTLQEVSAATGGRLSPSYISQLRRGVITRPSGETVQVLAGFFGVEIGYFYGTEAAPGEAADMLTPELLRALGQPGVLDMVVELGALSPEERKVFLAMATHALTFVAGQRGKDRAAAPDTSRDTAQS